jgi:DNA-binding PadR family transcriptional regulator
MRKREFIGTLELMVLSAVLRTGRNASGIPIAAEIEAATGRPISLGSTYATLSRLEDKDLVASARGTPTPERGGRAKVYFRLTSKGLRELQHSQRSLGLLWGYVPDSSEKYR